MSDNQLAGLQRVLNDIKVRARGDANLSIEKLTSLFDLIHEVEISIDEYRGELSQGRTHPNLDAVERLRRKLIVIEAIQGMQNPSYFDEFASTLAEQPYALPKALFDPQGKETVTIDFPASRGGQQFHKERMDMALSMLYPGSFSYRYGTPMKIETGPFSQRFVATLRMHTLSPEPIFSTKKEGRMIDVFKPIKLKARLLDNTNPFICLNCLSISGFDEGCSHAQGLKQPRKLPSSSPVTSSQELERQAGRSVELRSPLNSIISSVTFLERLKVGRAVLGFERSAAGRVAIVDYDPAIGMVMESKGVAFTVGLTGDVLDYLLSVHVLSRDTFVQLLARRISSLLSQNGMPSYHLEPILSGLVSALELEHGSKSIDSILSNFATGGWIEPAMNSTMAEGTRYYPRFSIQNRMLRNLFLALSRQSIDLNAVREEIRNKLLHSLAHNLLIAGCVTAGCLPTDLEYLIGDDEIVLFDSVDGGNGSSAMVFEFVSSNDSFDLTEAEEESSKERAFRPKYFDEAFAELMLPCPQGVSDRIFHRGLQPPQLLEIRRRIAALQRQQEGYALQYQRISQLGVENCFISSIGFHLAMELNMDLQDAERLKESMSICLHGCPDCLSLGNRCEEGGFLEKYNISKITLDEYFRYKTRPYTLDFEADDGVIESLLRSNGVAILSTAISTQNEQGSVTDRLQGRVSEFRGKKLGDKFIKFAGFWIDSPIAASEITYSALLVLV